MAAQLKGRQDTEIGFMFIHGAGLRGNVWEAVTSGLDVPVLLADFPYRDGSEQTRLALTLDDYASHLCGQAESWNIPRVIVVAHSIGGVLALQVAEALLKRGRLAGLAAVGAAIPGRGGSFLSELPLVKRALLRIVMRVAGTRPPESAIRTGLCNDLPESQSAGIVQAFVPEARRIYSDACHAGVPDVPSLYVKLTRDREFSPALQDRMIANLGPGTVRQLDTGHLPMLGNPDGLRAILQSFMAECVDKQQ
ncbi:alpha/beta fold hydrolase [Paenibacillus sacheonensis]|uniref:Alpha/beta fold hydrolase n=1 Tax=Paenibacillus sacheonensis TaxID=742054 RepID=A0A7X5C178_9BACL|nr:alpha/beta hydrolase [Paenibacillus sacheonensis]MBM7568625.1 pimeloyl-ACP methyl ester carboxylesterase [Paenibacillus sacheonensis]NBC72482.1 alpha/beta fold hydrolase [Paenibacillus sacheonensis]